MNATELVERETSAHVRWWTMVERLPPDAERADGWSLKDVVAHLTAWQRYSTDRIRAIVRGEPDPGPPADTDAFNEQARTNAGPWDAVRDGAAAAHRTLLGVIAPLSDARIHADDALVEFIVRVNGSEHYEEHTPSDFTRVPPRGADARRTPGDA